MRSVFCTLSKTETDELNSHKDFMHYRKGQVVFREDTYPHGLFCIYSGKTILYRGGENGREQIVRLAKGGDILGYRALLSGEKYTSTCEAIEDSLICSISSDIVMKLLRGNPGVAFSIIRLLSADLKKAEQKVIGIAHKHVRGRMAETLLFIADTYGYEKDNLALNVVLRREDIANIAGTATETAIRILSEFRDEKLIDFAGKRIKILQPEKLSRIANIQK